MADGGLVIPDKHAAAVEDSTKRFYLLRA